MDFFNSFKKFLGLSSSNNDKYFKDDEKLPTPNARDDIIKEYHRNPEEYERFGFNVFSSPLEMHRYFEHEMNEIIKSFGMLGRDGSFFGNNDESFFGDINEPFFSREFNFDSSQFPQNEGFNEQQESNLRNRFLKPGYEKIKPNEKHKSDNDVDGKIDFGDLNSVLKGQQSQLQPRNFMYSQSVSTKTIRNADGTIETHRTVTDQTGNKETTITKIRGDKEYSITTKTDKNGQQEIMENLVNMDEEDKESFLNKNKPIAMLPDGKQNIPPNWFPFDNFFK